MEAMTAMAKLKMRQAAVATTVVDPAADSRKDWRGGSIGE
jgi:hypothetical protein